MSNQNLCTGVSSPTLLGIGGLLPVPINRALRRVTPPGAFPSRSDRLPPAGACLEDVAVGWGRRPADEKRLTRVKAGRARAFFECASSAAATDLYAFSIPRVVERNFLRAGPPSSAEESAREESTAAPLAR
jgi:hypothetical protein